MVILGLVYGLASFLVFQLITKDWARQAVLVAQGCQLSSSTPTLLDVQALGNVAVYYSNVFVTSATNWAKVINQWNGKKSNGDGFESQCQQMKFFHEISVKAHLL